jgi:uncharacterized protein (DUF433 family)
MDWRGCELVEVIAGKVSGAPLILETRIPADLIVNLFESGYSIGEIIDDYPGLKPDVVHEIVAFAHARQAQHA